MNPTLFKALVALFPSCVLLYGAGISLIRERTAGLVLQLIGAIYFVLVALMHIFEAVHFVDWMRWGSERSVGHYVDLVTAAFGLILFPTGYLLHALSKRNA